MSKTPSQEKTQDLHKYWNSTTPKSAYREKEHPISSDIKPIDTPSIDTSKTPLNVTNKETNQPISSDSDQNNSLNDKKRKGPVKETTQEETSSPPLKRMHETTENKDEFHRSLSSSNLQAGTPNHNLNLNINPNPS